MSSLEVGESDLETITIANDCDRSRDPGDLEAHVLEERVADQINGVDTLQVDSAQCGEEGVLDVQTAGLAQTTSKTQGLQVGKTCERKAPNLLKSGHGD